MIKNFVHFISSHQSIIFGFIISNFFFFLYIYKIVTIPGNLTGDEGTYLESVYQILYSNNFVSPFALLGDGSQPAINFYWMTIWIKTVGLENAVLGMRLSTAILSICTLLIFFIILKRKTSPIIAFLFTFLLGTNILILNFSRSGWFNIGAVLFGMIMIFYLEKGIENSKIKFSVFAGLAAGIASYSYFAGKIFPLAACLYFIYLIVRYRFETIYIKQFCVFVLILLLSLIPLSTTIFNNFETYFLRPSTVLNKQLFSEEFPASFIEPTKHVIQGLLLLDGRSIGNGLENQRYSPQGESVTNIFIQILFLSGIVLTLIKKQDNTLWWFVYISTLIFLGILTSHAPNLARTLPAIPFIYLISGITIYYLLQHIKQLYYSHFIVLITTFILIIGITNIINYYRWITSEQVLDVRQPVLYLHDFQSWQMYQINQVKSGLPTITYYDWELIKETQ